MSSSIDEHQNLDPQQDRARVMREILDARARQLSQSLADEPLASEFVELLTFSVGRDQFAIETRYVTEVLREVEVTPLPGETSPLVGLSNLRGEVLAVMSLAGILPLATEIDADEAGSWIIVLGADQAMFGITVSNVIEVAAFSHGQILESAIGTTAINSHLFRGVTADARVVFDGRAVLEDPRFVIDQE